MKDFDEKRRGRLEEDRSFTMGGETFVRRSGVRPEAIVEFDSMSSDTSATEALRIIDEMVTRIIEPDNDAHERYRRLREREEDPVTLEDLQDLAEWLVEGVTGRPLPNPSPSLESPVGNGTGSMGSFSSVAVAEPAASTSGNS